MRHTHYWGMAQNHYWGLGHQVATPAFSLAGAVVLLVLAIIAALALRYAKQPER